MKFRIYVQVFFIILTAFLYKPVFAQTSYHLKGMIMDGGNNNPLPGLELHIDSAARFHTNSRGDFDLKLSKGKHVLVIITEGYNNFRKELNINSDSIFNIWLTPNSSLMDEVKVIRSKSQEVSGSASQTLTKKDLEKVPSFMGQRDPLKAVQTLPGIANAGEGNAGLYVRGGTAGQNLTMLNEATIYNPSHLLGFFSVFNADATNTIKLYKSGIPAEFGGRLSSIIEVNSDKTIADSLSAKGDISVLAASASITAPILSNWSFSLSARKTFMDLTVWPVLNKLNLASKLFSQLNYDFGDLNLTSNARLSKHDYINFSTFSSGDVFGFGLKSASIFNNMNWKNTAASLSWIKFIQNNIFVNTTVSFSGYKFDLDMQQENYKAGINSNIKDFNVKSILNLNLEKHYLKAGIQTIYHHFKPNTPYSKLGETELDFGKPNIYNAQETSVFTSDEFNLSEKTKVYAGGRLTYYQHTGPYTDISVDGQDVVYSKNNKVADFMYLEPSLVINRKLNNRSSLRVSLSKNVQPLHLLSVTAVNFPTDFWIPSLKSLPPEKGLQISAGYFASSKNKKVEGYADLYYKSMKGLLEYSGGIMNLLDNLKIENRLSSGKGNACGAEFFIKKKTGKLTGWVGYTLAKADRNFPLINGNKAFSAKYDRRHDLSLVSSYSVSPKWSISSYFTYATGNTYTKPVSRYIMAGNIINEYGEYNGSRMPAYHRLDLSASYKIKNSKNFKSEINLSVYNVYNRQNPIFLYFVAKGNPDKNVISVKPESISILPILPSLTYRFSF